MNTCTRRQRRGILRGVAGMIFGGYMSFAFGATNYVDCTMKDYTGHDGTSWAKAFKTIQEGVNAAALDDVVLVAPGYYDEGGATAGSSENYLTNRVYISKRITVRSRDGRASRDKTFIVGRHASEPQDPKGMGMGLDAIRCVKFMDNVSALGAVVEGFTLINGATHYYNLKGQAAGYDRNTVGGGADFCSLTTSTKTPSFLVDCVISNCVATRGGGMYFGNAVRCRFTGNYANQNSPAVRDGNMYYCISDGNFGASSPIYLGGANAINCTIVNEPEQTTFRGNVDATPCIGANCVVLQHRTVSSGNRDGICISLSNCVIAANAVYYNHAAAVGTTETNTCKLVDMNSYQFVSTATGDLRPLSTGDLPGAGDASLLSYIPEQYRYTDYEGKPVPTSGPITAGAIQTPVTPVGGCIQYSSFAYETQDTPGLRVNGYKMCIDRLYSFATRFPDPYRIECLMPLNPAKLATRKFFGFSANQDGVFTTYRFPMRGTRMAYVMSPPLGSVLTVIAVVTENSLWTDPSVPDGAFMDGTEEHPYNTLQGAVNVALAAGRYWCVFAKKGVYDKGGVSYGGVTNRVAVSNNSTYVNLCAVDGPEETFIVGAGDESSDHPYKLGSAAVRCVASANGAVCVNGFTLTGGHSDDSSGQSGYGGAIYSASPNFQVEDCIITNCVATRGAIAWQATVRRCRIVDCVSTVTGAFRYGCHVGACVLENVRTAAGSVDVIVGNKDFAYNCTFIGSDAADVTIRPVANGDAYGDCGMFNSVVWGFDTIPHTPNALMDGFYYGNCGNIGLSMQTRAGCTSATIGFGDKAVGDYSLCSSSVPVVNGGSTLNVDGKYWAYAPVVDIEGNEFEFGPDGQVAVGAYVRTTPSVSVTASASTNVTAVSISPEGEQFLTANTPSITFTATDAATRNYQGFYLDGELVTPNSTYTYTYDGENAGGRFDLEAKYSPYWYVDPTKSDSNSGCDWENAKKTLAGVMAKALPGDTVYAAPGVYEEGDMIQHKNSYKDNNTATLRARVVITNNVMLISRDGPETTIIKGASYVNNPSSLQTQSSYGLGTDALRCAFLYPDAVLDGFTLSGGRGSGGTDYDENDFGAGATGSYGSGNGVYPEIRNCIVTNCIAQRGGGTAHIKAVNCRFYGNRCFNNSAAGIHTRFINCLFDYNKGSQTVVGYWTEMRNCTFGTHNEADAVLGVSAVSGYVQLPAVYNTLFLAGKMSVVNSASIQAAFTNCAFTTYMYSKLPTNALTNDTCVIADASMLQVDADGRPIIGANLAIDAGDTNYLNLAKYPTDIDGNPRAVNGLKMDIGCYEADWKGRYGADLGSTRVAVSSASPAVCETAQRTIAMYDGTEVSLAIANPSGRDTRKQISFRVNGEGSLSMSVDGGAAMTFTDTGAVQTYELRNAATSTAIDMTFAGAGSAELVNCGIRNGIAVILR